MIDRICAVVSSFNSPAELIGTLCSVVDQVEHTYVIDDNSTPSSILEIEERIRSLPSTVSFVRGEENRGLAESLNRGMRLALANGFDAVVLLDQDSRCEAGLVKVLQTVMNQDESIGICAPQSTDSLTGRSYGLGIVRENSAVSSPDVHRVDLIHTSGNLLRTRAFLDAGEFRSDYVIDQIDYEYCFRLRKKGWSIVVASSVAIVHSLGSISRHRLFGRGICCTNHSSLRRYYISRNRIKTMLIHRDRSYIVNQLKATAFDLVKIGLFEGNKVAKIG
jgi:rhamnosyltransferase